MRQGVEREVVVQNVVLDDQGGKQISVRIDGKAPTLRAETHGNLPCVMEPIGFDSYNLCETGDIGRTICTPSGGLNEHIPLVCVPYTLKIRSGCEGGGKGALIQKDKSATIATNNDQYLFQPIAYGFDAYNQALTGDKTLTIRAAKSDNDHLPLAVYAVDQGGGKSGANVTENLSPTLTCTHGGEPVICMATQQGGAEIRTDDKAPTLTAAAGMSGNNQPVNTVDRPAVCYRKPHYIVRRLTPTECARLQGFADKWGHPDIKEDFMEEEYRFWLEVRNTHSAINGKQVKEYTIKQMLTWYNKLHTDSAEYKMWGNGIALPPALYCMQGIVKACL